MRVGKMVSCSEFLLRGKFARSVHVLIVKRPFVIEGRNLPLINYPLWRAGMLCRLPMLRYGMAEL
jgi:hypothetical protein